jgi:hypothetical protein
LRHYKARRRYYQIKFPSGERAVVLVAGMPSPSVELVRLVLGGVIPWQTVWEYNPMRAGGYSDYIHKLKTMFAASAEESDDSLDRIREALHPCQSIEEARMLLLQRERLANSPAAERSDSFANFSPRSDLTNTASNNGWKQGSPASQKVSFEKTETSTIPDRYRIKSDARGRFLTCVEAPTVAVRAERSMALSDKQARNSKPGTIFLGGAARGDPFVDSEREVYSLKHHQGCLWSSASCEQAILLIRHLRDLRRRDWTVLANDVELDIVFAVWVLLNHVRLNDEPKVCAKIMPLLRLEGVIAAHGREAQELTAFPPDLLHSTSTMLKELHRQESVYKDYGRWSEIDYLDYLADRLRAVDELIYSAETFEGVPGVEELGRAEITNGCVAVIYHSEAGVDQVERQLRRLYGERLGVLISQNSASAYVVRLANRALPATLEGAYERLNLLDPAVRGDSQNRWAGSSETGASPRKTGTGLDATQILEAVRKAFQAPSLADVVCEIPRAMLLALAALLLALAPVFTGDLLWNHGYVTAQTVLLSAITLTLAAGIVYGLKARRVPGLYGWRRPSGYGQLMVLPGAILGALGGGVWAPGSLAYRIGPHINAEFSAAAALLYALAAELLFRGVVLGDLAARLPLQNSRGRWWGSWPTLISSGVYAAGSLILFLSFSNWQLIPSQCFAIVGGAIIFGVASGMARERSGSILSSVLLHCVCAAALLFSSKFLF